MPEVPATPPSTSSGPPIPLHELLGLQFGPAEADGRISTVTMPVRAESFGSGGNLHGGAIATMVDLASALAAVRSADFDLATQSLITTDLHVRYVGQPRTAHVLARAEVIRSGRQIIVVECRVSDENDHLVAAADIGMMIVERRRPVDTGTGPASG